MWSKLVNFYRTVPWFQKTVQALEGGLAFGFVTATTNGIDLSKKGLTALGASLVGGAVVALRNLLTQETIKPQ